MHHLRELLARHPSGVSVYDLARALQVDPRTVRRYLKEIERDYELAPLRPRGGGPRLWRIHPRELPRKVEMRRTQVYALLAARRVYEGLQGSALFDEIDLVIGRLLAFADRPGRGPNAGLVNSRLEQRFVYIPRRTADYSDKSVELDELFQAVSELRPLVLRYRPPRTGGRAAQREDKLTFHPYALVLYGDAVYAVGLDPAAECLRTLALEGMRDTEVQLEQRFSLPEEFRVEDHFEGELGPVAGPRAVRVVVELSREAAAEVRARKLHPGQRLSSLSGGRFRLSLRLEEPLSVLGWVLGQGSEAQVLEPPELRDAVRKQLQAALAQYEGVPRPRRTRR